MNKLLVSVLLFFCTPLFAQQKLLNEAEREIVKKLYKVAEQEGWFFSRFGVFTIKIMEESDSLTHWNCSIIYENNREEELPFAYAYIQQVPLFSYGKEKQGSLKEIEEIALSRLYLKSVKMDRKMPLRMICFGTAWCEWELKIK